MNTSLPVVHVVDDELSYRKALERLLRAAGYTVRTHDSVAAFLAAEPGRVPGCVVADLQMPGLSGLDLQERLSSNGSLMPMVFLTGHGDIPSSVRALRRGAVHFLTKPVVKEDLFAAVEQALERDAAARRHDADLEPLRRRFAALSHREREVLVQVIAGRLNKQIAAELGLSERTVKAHRGNVMRKLDAGSLPDLVRLAEALGVEPV